MIRRWPIALFTLAVALLVVVAEPALAQAPTYPFGHLMQLILDARE